MTNFLSIIRVVELAVFFFGVSTTCSEIDFKELIFKKIIKNKDFRIKCPQAKPRKRAPPPFRKLTRARTSKPGKNGVVCRQRFVRLPLGHSRGIIGHGHGIPLWMAAGLWSPESLPKLQGQAEDCRSDPGTRPEPAQRHHPPRLAGPVPLAPGQRLRDQGDHEEHDQVDCKRCITGNQSHTI